jgi:hypothetical protein
MLSAADANLCLCMAGTADWNHKREPLSSGIASSVGTELLASVLSDYFEVDRGTAAGWVDDFLKGRAVCRDMALMAQYVERGFS